MGRLIQKQSPTVDLHHRRWTPSSARPTEKYYYDVSGRMIGTDTSTTTVNSTRITPGPARRHRPWRLRRPGQSPNFMPTAASFRTYYDVFGDARDCATNSRPGRSSRADRCRRAPHLRRDGSPHPADPSRRPSAGPLFLRSARPAHPALELGTDLRRRGHRLRHAGPGHPAASRSAATRSPPATSGTAPSRRRAWAASAAGPRRLRAGYSSTQPIDVFGRELEDRCRRPCHDLRLRQGRPPDRSIRLGRPVRRPLPISTPAEPTRSSTRRAPATRSPRPSATTPPATAPPKPIPERCGRSSTTPAITALRRDPPECHHHLRRARPGDRLQRRRDGSSRDSDQPHQAIYDLAGNVRRLDLGPSPTSPIRPGMRWARITGSPTTA